MTTLHTPTYCLASTLMSRKTLHDVARADTPSQVDVPDSWSGLVVWAVGRFGIGLVVAVAAIYALREVYNDMRSQNREIIAALITQTEVNAKTVSALDSIRGEIHDAHVRMGTTSLRTQPITLPPQTR